MGGAVIGTVAQRDDLGLGGIDLWTSFNRVQERVIRGGMDVTLRKPVTHEDGTEGHILSTRRATAIRGAVKQVRLNEELFRIGEEFATVTA